MQAVQIGLDTRHNVRIVKDSSLNLAGRRSDTAKAEASDTGAGLGEVGEAVDESYHEAS